jgi:hypothetical protein
MADTLNLSNFTSLGEGYAALAGSTYSTGDLRRKYNFGDRFSELKVMQDPYFRLMSVLRKGSVDDSIFKFAEKRPSWNKRYAYVVAHAATSAVGSTDATVTAASIEAGDTYYWKMGTDYDYRGNVSNKYGQATNEITIGDAYTRPTFFLPDQTIRIPFGTAYNNPSDYVMAKILEVTDVSNTHVILKTEITKTLNTATSNELQFKSATAPMDETYSYATALTRADGLESKRTYVVGTAYAPGTGYPDTWADNPFSTGYGFTEIWKVALGMDNTTRATRMKFQPNEWQRLWVEKLLESKWDINHSLYFSGVRTDSDGAQHTQGIVDYTLNYGNVFSLTTSTKTCDDFLDDMSQFMDPRVNSAGEMVYFCDTESYNWLNKMSGFFANSLEVSSNIRGDFASLGKDARLAKKTGVDANIISTIYGDMRIVRDIHLDGSPVKIMGVNLNNVEYCPLIGNGINRDTSIYVGVQTLENSGVDKRIDLILTEAGQKCTLPETHAVWK